MKEHFVYMKHAHMNLGKNTSEDLKISLSRKKKENLFSF